MNTMLQTERLILREVDECDLDGLFKLDSDPEVHRYLGNNCVTSRDEAAKTISSLKKQYAENGIGRWAIIHKLSGEFIGWTGLKLVKDTLNGHTDFYDLGYRLRREFWGNGYASESALASLNYGFETMKIETIYASAHVENIQSNKILKKLGFQFVETYPYESWIKNWYEITHKAN